MKENQSLRNRASELQQEIKKNRAELKTILKAIKNEKKIEENYNPWEKPFTSIEEIYWNMYIIGLGCNN